MGARQLRNQARLTLHLLEGRCVPAVTIIPDTASSTFTILGDQTSQLVSILDTPGVTSSINIDSDGNGSLDIFLDSRLLYGVTGFDHYVFKMGGGDDQLEARLLAGLTGGTRTYQVDETSGNNTFLFDSNGFAITAGSLVSLEYLGGRKGDAATGLFNAVASSSIDFTMEGLAGNDQLSFLFRDAMSDTAFKANIQGGRGDDALNAFYQNTNSWDASTMTMIFDGAQGVDTSSMSINSGGITNGSAMNFFVNAGQGDDLLNYRLNAILGPNSSVTLDGSLGDGRDSFTSTLGYDRFVDDATSLSIIRVSGGDDADQMFVLPFTYLGKEATVNGRLQYFLSGDAGDDTVTYTTLDLFGTGARLKLGPTGRYLLSIDGGSRDDVIDVSLYFSSTSDASGEAAITVAAGSGDDLVRFSGSDPVGITYEPNGKAILDGGGGTDTLVIVFNDPAGDVPLDIINFEIVI